MEKAADRTTKLEKSQKNTKYSQIPRIFPKHSVFYFYQKIQKNYKKTSSLVIICDNNLTYVWHSSHSSYIWYVVCLIEMHILSPIISFLSTIFSYKYVLKMKHWKNDTAIHRPALLEFVRVVVRALYVTVSLKNIIIKPVCFIFFYSHH